MNLGRTVAAVILGLTLLVGVATAAQPCGSAAIRDWYDNERIDGSWSCPCLLDGLAGLREEARPGDASIGAVMERHLRAQCATWSSSVVPDAVSVSVSISVPAPVPVPVPVQSEAAPPVRRIEHSAVDTAPSVDDDLLPWDALVVGIFMGALAVLVGAGLLQRRRLRP